MQTTSALYNTILADPNHWFETRIIFNIQPRGTKTYYENSLFSITTNVQMFQDCPTIGKAVAGEIYVKMLKPSEEIPTMARMRPQVRVCRDVGEEVDGEWVVTRENSEWLPQGTYFIDTRETTKNDSGLDVFTVHGYDAMLRAEQMYNGRITGDSTDIQMLNEIAYQMNVSVDERTPTLMSKAYTIPMPTGYTYREILGYIASMYVGCFIMSEEGKLRLVTITELPEETNLLVTEGGVPIQFGDDCILLNAEAV